MPIIARERKRTERGTTRGGRFHATSPLLITSRAVNDETTMYLLYGLFPSSRSSTSRLTRIRYASFSSSRIAAATNRARCLTASLIIFIVSLIDLIYKETKLLWIYCTTNWHREENRDITGYLKFIGNNQ